MHTDKKIIFYVKANHQLEYARFLADGMKAHGYHNIKIRPDVDVRENPDLAVFWSHKKTGIINHQISSHKKYLVMERAYIGDRHHWVSLGYNGLNGRADFCNKDIADSTRWDKHFSEYLKPWKQNENGYVLLIGQVRTDASVRHINILDWYKRIISQLNARNIPVVFRRHPLDKGYIDLRGLKYTEDTNDRLEDSLHGARCVVTYSSNSGVISVLNGIPTISSDIGSMVYGVSSHDLKNLDYTPDRQDWCNKIAYCQWLPDELSDGTAWEHLKQGLV